MSEPIVSGRSIINPRMFPLVPSCSLRRRKQPRRTLPLSVRRRKPSVNREHVTVDVRGFIRGEKNRGATDLTRIAPSFQRNSSLQKGLNCGIPYHRRVGLGREKPRRDGICRYSQRTELDGKRPSERGEPS